MDLSCSGQARIEQVTKTIAHEVQAQHSQRNGYTWIDRQHGGLKHLRLRFVQHAAPTGLRGLCAQA